MPTLRFNGYNEEWMPCLLSDAAYYLKDRKQAIKSIFISTENMCQNCSGIEQYIDSSVVEGIAFSKNDILIANIRPYLKKAWKATFNGVCSTDVLALHIEKALPDFIYRIIENDDFFVYVMSAAKGSKMPRGDKQHIMNYQIALPSVQEQQKISDFLQCLDLRIIKQRQLINSLESYKRGLQQAVFREISHNIKLKDCVLFEPKSTIAAGDSCDDGKYILYRSGQKDGRTNDCTHNGVYIIANDGGEAKFKLTNGAFAYTDHCICLRAENDIMTVLLANYLQMIAARITYEGFVGSGLKNIDRQYFCNIKMPIITNQQQVAHSLILVDKCIEQQVVLMNYLLTEKQALLQQLFI